MKISEIIKELQEIMKDEGDIPCLIEYTPIPEHIDGNESIDSQIVEVGELLVEDRPTHGRSITFII